MKALTTALSAFVRRLPTSIDRRVLAAAWTSLVVQIGIVGTGGAVRLTGSGLGCPTWPLCTEGSLVNTPEMGIHGVIEFGNRLLTVVLVVVVIVMFLAVVRMRRSRPDVFTLALLLGLGIPAQAVLGGITVLTGLDSWLVGAHFVVSIVLVVLATWLLVRVRAGRETSGPVESEMASSALASSALASSALASSARVTSARVMSAPASRRVATTVASSDLIIPRAVRVTALVTAVLVGVTVLVGVVTTGSGPHAGDADTPRNGLDPAVLQHVHSWPAYLTFGLTLLLLVMSIAMASGGHATVVTRPVVLLLAVEVAQIVVGITQSRLGLPALLVGIHMVLACLLVSAMTTVVLATRMRTTMRDDADDSDNDDGRRDDSRRDDSRRTDRRPVAAGDPRVVDAAAIAYRSVQRSAERRV